MIRQGANSPYPRLELPAVAPLQLNAHCRLTTVAQLPEPVSAILPLSRFGQDYLYVGTRSRGGVYQIRPMPPYPCRSLQVGMGDDIAYGTCEVNWLAARDLDGDGTQELLAGTNQVTPRGRPRVYLWSLTGPETFHGMAPLGIASSWSHGVGFRRDAHSGRLHAMGTFCGYGEVVEYRLANESTTNGFVSSAIEYRKIGSLPGSGEGMLSADVDNDGNEDLILASGFRENEAQILVYVQRSVGADAFDPCATSPARLVAKSFESSSMDFESAAMRNDDVVDLGPNFDQTCRIDEGKRFANVRFLVGDTTGDGGNDLVAWWCTELAGGDCEVVRYHLLPDGVKGREVLARGPAGELWPIDNQMTIADLDLDRVPEVWFATGRGNLWCFDPSEKSRRGSSQIVPSAADAYEPVLIGQFADGIGPIAATAPFADNQPALYVGTRDLIIRLTWHAAAGERSRHRSTPWLQSRRMPPVARWMHTGAQTPPTSTL